MSRYLVTPGQLERILHRRALGDRVDDIAAVYNLDPCQISRLIHKNKPRFLTICRKLEVLPPAPGGQRKNSGRKKVPDEKKVKNTVDYHAYTKQQEIIFVTLVCLQCREEFESENKSKNRICKSCKTLDRWGAGPDFTTGNTNRRNFYHSY